jgi:predicted kinase
MEKFEQFLAEFKLTPYWATMVNTVEDSPWHREANVALHTEMSLEQFDTRFAANYSRREALVGRVAILFHDTGKPSAEEVLEKKDGSGEKYRRYAGHEQDSAVAFQECYLTMSSLRALLTPEEARAIRWIIEHHLPYGYKDKQKRQGLAVATWHALYTANCRYELFFDCLRSDAAGRISDDMETKLQNVEDWVEEFKKIPTARTAAYREQIAFLLIGPSGSGKSTYVRHASQNGDEIISYDDLKEQFWYHKGQAEGFGFSVPTRQEQYDLAWAYANENESEFKKFSDAIVAAQFEMASKSGANVFVDMVNASKKKRAKFVDLANRFKFRVVAVEFWNPLDELIRRQKTRPDKSVPPGAVKQQLYAIGGAWLGSEVDRVELVLPT